MMSGSGVHPSVAGPASAQLRLLASGSEADFRELARFADFEDAAFERVSSPAAIVRALADGAWDLVFVPLDGEPEDQLRWWGEVLGRIAPRPRLVVLSREPSAGFGLRASHLGVFDILLIPASRERFHAVLQRVRTYREETIRPLPEVRSITIGGYEIVSGSSAMLPVFRAIAQVRRSTASVLITGRVGHRQGAGGRARSTTRLAARRARSSRSTAPPFPRTCSRASSSATRRAPSPGAVARQASACFEPADGGTLFLDEIGDMPPGAAEQAPARAPGARDRARRRRRADPGRRAAHRRHQPRSRARWCGTGGSARTSTTASTVMTIELPPLRERHDDIPLLVEPPSCASSRPGTDGRSTGSPTAMALLAPPRMAGQRPRAPNVIERAVVVADGSVLRAEHLPEEWRTDARPEAEGDHGIVTLQEMEARHIARVLAYTGGQIGEAARLLGVHRNTLARKVRTYGL